MRIEEQIQDTEMKLKALHYERDQMKMAAMSQGAIGRAECASTMDPRWTPEGIRDIVSYHSPNREGIAAITGIRNATEMFIRAIVEHAPECADRSAAIRHAREAMMTANAAIVLNGRI